MAGIYDDTPTSRFEEIMRAIIDGTEYTHEPRSVEEALLIELNDLIKAGGGGGGGTTNYNALSNKPKINGVTLQGNLTAEDLEIDKPLTTEQLNALLALIPE